MKGLLGPGKVCLMTSFVGYGDLLYLTPLIRFLKRSLGLTVDVWAVNPEPYLNNPDIEELYTFKKTDQIVKPLDFYKRTFNFCGWGEGVFIGNTHPVDYFTQKALGINLRNKEKDLIFGWHPDDEAKVKKLLFENDLRPVDGGKLKVCNYVIVSPVVTWESKTLPLDFYQNLCRAIQDNGDRILLVGKDVTHAGVKTLYPASEFPGAIDFTNKLSLAEAGALYGMSKIAISNESANMLLACTNEVCWNIFLATLTPPEFRLPWRQGYQDYRSFSVGNAEDYFPATDYKKLGEFTGDLRNLPVQYPTADDVFRAYYRINNHLSAYSVDEI